MAVKKYQKRSAPIEAVQWTGENLTELRQFCPNLELYVRDGFSLSILEVGYYLVKTQGGYFYSCPPDIFTSYYSEITE